MKNYEDIHELYPSQMEKLSSRNYHPGTFKVEAKEFFKKCVGEKRYEEIMRVDAGRRHPYVAARLFLSPSDWEKYIWMEQHGSLDGYPD